MKICWDNLEGLRYNRKLGKWYKGDNAFIYCECCENCGENFLARTISKAKFCTNKCKNNKGMSGKNHPMYGKHHSRNTREKISKANKGRKVTGEALENIKQGNQNKNRGKDNPMYGKYGKLSGNWKGSNGFPLYDTYAHQIEYAEEVRKSPKDENILEVKCAYCGKWHIPKYSILSNRVQFLKGNYPSENRFYCSDYCREECPVFNTKIYPKGYKKASSREVQPELRQLVFERDNWTCQKCRSTQSLHCHHIEGILWEPLESADIDKCITYCKKCHKEVHKKDGCNYNEMKCL